MMGAIHRSAMKTSTDLGAWMATDLGANMGTTGTSTHTATEALGTCMGTEAWLVLVASMDMGTSMDSGMATPSFRVLATDTAIESASMLNQQK